MRISFNAAFEEGTRSINKASEVSLTGSPASAVVGAPVIGSPSDDPREYVDRV
jgi:hypothetical protein